MKITVLANGDFAAPSLELLAETGSVNALFVMPVRGKRKGDAEISAVRQVAARFGLPVFEPENINAPEEIERLCALDSDLLFVCDYGKILSPETIASTRLGGVNLHGSLLPSYRGAAPINRAIYDGETVLGVSVLHITPEVDAGPVIAAASLETSPDETAIQIEKRLARLGAPLLLEAIKRIFAGTATPIEQNNAAATKAPKLKKEEGRIDWSRTARQIVNQYRAFVPWPKTFSDWVRADAPDKPPLRLILGPLAVGPNDFSDAAYADAAYGEIVAASGNELWVRCGDGTVRVERVQPAGKREMPAEEFLRGYRMKPGENLN